MRKRTTYHHGDLRNALITAALALIAEHGVEGFTLRDCAKKAGVSVAAPYRHFTDRDDLLAAVAADCMQRLGDAMERAVEAAGSVDPLSVFRATGIAYVRFAVEHPAHFRVMNLPQVVARTPPELRDAVDAWGLDMAAKLAAAQGAGTVAPLPLADIMLAASCLTHGLAHMIVDGIGGLGDLDPDAAAQLAVTVTGVIGCGLLPRTGADAIAAAPPPSSSKPKAKPRRRGARGAGALVLGAIALTGARADAKGPSKLMVGRVTSVMTDDEVMADQFPSKPPAGAYLVLGVAGPIALVALDPDRTSAHKGACPYDTGFRLTGDVMRPLHDAVAMVVIGPIDPTEPPPKRLMKIGLGITGASKDQVEPLGVAAPAGVDPSWAIDLDGDGAADVIVATDAVHGPFVHGIAKIKSSTRTWQRRGKRWSQIGQCSWVDHDLID